jgi:transposase InsO family protein
VICDISADPVINAIKEIFSTHGIPHQVISDNGPPFNSYQFKLFASAYDFSHVTMSPLHSQTNGLVEKAVGTVKKVIVKCKEDNSDLSLALLNVRNTPRLNVGSAVQRLMGRHTDKDSDHAESLQS